MATIAKTAAAPKAPAAAPKATVAPPAPAVAPAPAASSKTAPPKTVALAQALKDFCASDKVRVDPEAFCKYDSLVKHFRDYCKEKNISPDAKDAMSVDALYAATGSHVERDTYRAYPGKHGTIHKSTWILGFSIVADEVFSGQLDILCDFLSGSRGVFAFDTGRYMKYSDFLTCLDGYRLQRRFTAFKPSARLLKEICVRYNLALESNGIRDGVKGKYLLGIDFA